MDYKELIEKLRNNNVENNCHDCALGYYAFEAATAITDLMDRCTRLEEARERANEAAHQWEGRCKALETRLETAEKMVKEYQDVIVPGYRDRAEKAERERDAALKDLREAAWCMHCNNWEDMKKCMELAKKDIRYCASCKEKCSCRDCESGSKWKWRGAKEE